MEKGRKSNNPSLLFPSTNYFWIISSGGIFKETDVGKWVHLVCALYIPGIAFGDPDRLSNVTLFEISSGKWGSKACQLCHDTRFIRTGMTTECDAGMCRNYFHVTWWTNFHIFYFFSRTEILRTITSIAVVNEKVFYPKLLPTKLIKLIRFMLIVNFIRIKF